MFFEFYRQKMDTRNIEPNITHKVLAKMEAAGKLKAVVTQNIDGLHQKAGSRNVYEIHGTTLKNYCCDCGRKYPANTYVSYFRGKHLVVINKEKLNIQLDESDLFIESTLGAVFAEIDKWI